MHSPETFGHEMGVGSVRALCRLWFRRHLLRIRQRIRGIRTLADCIGILSGIDGLLFAQTGVKVEQRNAVDLHSANGVTILNVERRIDGDSGQAASIVLIHGWGKLVKIRLNSIERQIFRLIADSTQFPCPDSADGILQLGDHILIQTDRHGSVIAQADGAADLTDRVATGHVNLNRESSEKPTLILIKSMEADCRCDSEHR